MTENQKAWCWLIAGATACFAVGVGVAVVLDRVL